MHINFKTIFLLGNKDKSVEVTEQIRKPSYSLGNQVIMFHRHVQWLINLTP